MKSFALEPFWKKSTSEVRVVSSNVVIFPLLYILFSTLLEVVSFVYLGFGQILPNYFLFDFGVMLILASVIFLVQNKIAVQVLFYLFLAAQAVMNAVNATMYKIFGDILSFDLLTLGGEATTAIEASFIDWWGILLNLVVFGIIVAVGVCLVKFNHKTIVVKSFSYPLLVIALVMLVCTTGLMFYDCSISSLVEAQEGENEIECSDVYLWENFQFKIDAMEKFGIFGFYIQSVNREYSNDLETLQDEQIYEDFIDSGYCAGDSTAPLYGDNLIVILCESLEWWAIDPFNTPTLYSMVEAVYPTDGQGDGQNSNSIAFDQYYSRNRTNNSEGIVLNGNMPRNLSLYDAYQNGYSFDYTLPKLFKSAAEEGTTTVTSYFHQNVGSFYNREDTHGQDGLGFDYLYFNDSYTGEQELGDWGEWMSDLEFTSSLMDEFIPTDCDRFFTFFASMSTHGPYTYDNPYFEEYYEIYDQNFEAFSTWIEEETDYVMPTSQKYLNYLKHYKAAAIDLDRTVANIISELEARGLADNTSILLFADHNAYYYNMCYEMKGLTKTDYSNIYAHNVPLILYSPKLTSAETNFQDGAFVGGGVVSDFCNTYDVLPTICALFGMASNTNLFHGYSIFSDEIINSFFSSNLNGMFAKGIYSTNISNKIILSKDVTEEDIARFEENAINYYTKQAYIETIYKYGINGTIET